MGRGERLHHPNSPRLTAVVDRIITALADPNRRRAVELLVERPRRAGELASALQLSPPTLSRHLRIMKQSGLIEESQPEFDARVRIYRLKDGALAELQQWVAATEAMWATQLLAFKAHVEAADR